MNKAVEQIIRFTNTTPDELYDIYLDAKKHSAILDGAKVTVTKKEGAPFSFMDGNLKGKNLLLVPGRMIVQSWKGNVWNKDDLDSILILSFSAIPGGAQIHMVHSHTPNQFTNRWEEIYWTPLKTYLANKQHKVPVARTASTKYNNK